MYVGKVVVYVFATVDSQIGRKSLWQSVAVKYSSVYVFATARKLMAKCGC